MIVHTIAQWLYIHLGCSGGAWTNWWGGFASDISEFALLGGITGLLRSRNCEVHHCWRLGRHATAAQHKVCRKHHPDDSLSAQDVLDAHQAAQEAHS